MILAGCSGLSFASDSTIEYSENTWQVFLASTAMTKFVQVIIALLMLWVLLGLLGFTVRRLHDSNHTGWWYWIICVPFGWLVLLYFLVLPTLEEPVRWGGYLFTKSK